MTIYYTSCRWVPYLFVMPEGHIRTTHVICLDCKAVRPVPHVTCLDCGAEPTETARALAICLDCGALLPEPKKGSTP